MIAKVPIKEMGMANTGIIVVLHCLKKTKITRTTRAKEKKMVSSTSLIPLRMFTVISDRTDSFRSLGISIFNRSTRL